MEKRRGESHKMKTKLAFIIFGALFLSTAGAFYYEGSPEEAGATEKSYIAEKEAESLKEVNSNEELSNGSVESAGEKANVVLEKESAESKDKLTESKEDVQTNREKAESNDSIQYGDSLYVNVMNEPKYQRQAKIAKKFGTELYAVPSTDLFAYFKGNEMVISKSTGVASANPQYVELLKELYSGEGFLYEGVIENIDFVNKTGAKVTVEFDRHEGYTISKKENGWILLSW
jgi:DNA mismatch repair ATPase MutL